jgi:penicillin-binding protein 1A
MAYAHQGVELKNIAGVAPNPASVGPLLTDASGKNNDVPSRPPVLSQRGVQVLLRIERMMDDASRAMVVSGEPAPTGGPRPGAAVDRPNSFASTSADRPAAVGGH